MIHQKLKIHPGRSTGGYVPYPVAMTLTNQPSGPTLDIEQDQGVIHLPLASLDVDELAELHEYLGILRDRVDELRVAATIGRADRLREQVGEQGARLPGVPLADIPAPVEEPADVAALREHYDTTSTAEEMKGGTWEGAPAVVDGETTH